MENKLNIICPYSFKKTLIQSGLFPCAHYYSKEELFDIAFNVYDDSDLLSFAMAKGVSYLTSKKQFETFRLFKETHFEKSGSPSYEQLYQNYLFAKENHFLHEPDYLNQIKIQSRKNLILGYYPCESDLVSALTHLGVKEGKGNGEFEFADVCSLLGKNRPSFSIQTYNEAWVEVMHGLSWIAQKLEEANKGEKQPDFMNFAILCPSSYNSILFATASLFNLPLNISLDTLDHLEQTKKFLSDLEKVHFKMDAFVAQYGKNYPGYQKIIVKLQEIVHTVSIPLREDLMLEFVKANLKGGLSLPKGSAINVYNSFSTCPLCNEILVLGFSDALISPDRDNGAIDDALKPQVSYLQTSVDKNLSKEKFTIDFFSLCGHLNLSKASVDAMVEYKPVFFQKEVAQFVEVHPAKEYYSFASQTNKRNDLTLYHAVFHNRYMTLKLMDEMAYVVARDFPILAAIYGSYDNDFDQDIETQAYFKKYFDKPISLSQSSLNTYQMNPFTYFVQNVLHINAPTSLVALKGTLLHSFMETRSSFNLKKELEKIFAENDFPIENMNRAQVGFFLEEAVDNCKKYVLPVMEDFEKQAHLTLLKPKGGKEEFSFQYALESLNAVIKGSYDAVFAHYDKEGVFQGYLVGDYKTGRDNSTYVDLFYGLLGRKLQLPLYCYVFENDEGLQQVLEEKKARLLGSYILSLNYQKVLKSPVGLGLGFEFNADLETNLYLPSKEQEGNIAYLSRIEKVKSNKAPFLTQIIKEQDGMGDGVLRKSPTLADRLVNVASLSVKQFVEFLRNGRLRTKENGICWFPVYQTIIYNPYNSLHPFDGSSLDDYQDISFSRGYQIHFIHVDEKNPSSNWNDYDSLKDQDELLENFEQMVAGDSSEDSEGGEKA